MCPLPLCAPPCLHTQVNFAAFLVYSKYLTLKSQYVGIRKSGHKLAREAMLCLLESCTRDEYDKVRD